MMGWWDTYVHMMLVCVCVSVCLCVLGLKASNVLNYQTQCYI